MRQSLQLRFFFLSLVHLPLLLLPGAGLAQTTPAVTWHGEIRPRFESRKWTEGETIHLTSMRTRFAMEARLEEGIRLFIQPQDVRDWGEEESERDRSADDLDFHQAFLEVGGLPGLGGLIRAGRQEIALAESRLLGAPDWGQAGQTFDAIRWIRPAGAGRVEIVYLKIQEGASDAHERDADFWAAWYTRGMGRLGSLDLLAVHNRSAGEDGTGQSTLGGVWKQSWHPFTLRFQGMLQVGEREGENVRAHMMAASAQWSAPDDQASVTLWYDHLSGDADPGDDEVGAFSTLYGARNRFYGRADYFTNIPRDTGGLGLRDAVLKLVYRPSDPLSLNLDLHAFRTAKPGNLSSQRLAEELDAWIRYRYRGSLTLQAGYAVTWGGNAMEELGRLQGTGTFGYLMTSVAF